MARFTREAQVLASLNHPNIAAIYGVEDRALVMELVEGAAPAGPLAAEEALPLIHQLIDALEYAHEKGIVHRDLKPANIKVTPEGRVKVLDFGLAKAMANEPGAQSDAANSPTLTMRATMAGVIMGTAAYMSPEQARGHAVDKRADIWAFGVVLYELLTGKPLFDGETVSDTLAAVLTRDADLAPSRRGSSGSLRLCLTRDPRQRLRDITGARLLLDETPSAVSAPASSKAPWLVAALLLAVLIAVGVARFRETPPPSEVVRFQVPAPEGGTFGATKIDVSKDGRSLVFVAYSKAYPQGAIWVRLDAVEPRALAGTENAVFPFWSPDGKSIGFWSKGALRRVDLTGGPVQTLCDTTTSSPTGNSAGAWDSDEQFSSPPEVPACTASPRREEPPREFSSRITRREKDRTSPILLPDRKHVLFSQHVRAGSMIWSSLDGKERKDLGPNPFSFGYAPPATHGAHGHLLFVQQGTLMAQPVDPATFAAAGATFGVADRVATGNTSASFAVSPSGTLAYRRGYSIQNQQLLWVDRSGKPFPPSGGSATT